LDFAVSFKQKMIIVIACVICGIAIATGVVFYLKQHDIVWQKACEEGLKEREQCNFQSAEKHLLVACANAESFPLTDVRRYSSNLALAELYIATGSFSKADTYLEKARVSAELQNDVEHKLKVLGLRADMLCREARFDDARIIYKEMSDLARKTHQTSFEMDALLGQAKLDLLYLRRNESEEAIEQIDSLTSALEEKTEYGVVLSIYTALLAELKGRYKTALMLFEDANHVVQNREKPSSSLKLLLGNNCATYYLQARNSVRARNLAVRVFDNCDKDFASYFDAHALHALRNLSSIYLEENELRRARQFIEKEVEAVGMRLSHNHPYYGVALEHRAVLESREGKTDEAARDFKAAQDIFVKTFGEKNRFSADTLADIAKVEIEKKNFDAASIPCKEALAIYKAILPYDHPSALKATLLLSMIYKEQGKQIMAHTLEVEASQGLSAADGK
jgi:hypothetical protein